MPSPRQLEGGATNPSRRATPTKPTVMKQGVHGRQYHNPDLIVRLIREVNKATLLIDGVQTMALVDNGAQMSTMTDSFTQQLGLSVQKLGQILKS